MSTEIKTKLKRYSVVNSWGGDHIGASISIACIDNSKFKDPNPDPIHQEGCIRLDMVEAYNLACTLIDFVRETIEVRQGYLKKEIKDLKCFENTIFKEASKLDVETLGLKSPSDVAVDLIDKTCPKAPKKRGEVEDSSDTRHE